MSILESGGMIMVLIEDFAHSPVMESGRERVRRFIEAFEDIYNGSQELRMLKAILSAKLPRTCI